MGPKRKAETEMTRQADLIKKLRDIIVDGNDHTTLQGNLTDLMRGINNDYRKRATKGMAPAIECDNIRVRRATSPPPHGHPDHDIDHFKSGEALDREYKDGSNHQKLDQILSTEMDMDMDIDINKWIETPSNEYTGEDKQKWLDKMVDGFGTLYNDNDKLKSANGFPDDFLNKYLEQVGWGDHYTILTGWYPKEVYTASQKSKSVFIDAYDDAGNVVCELPVRINTGKPYYLSRRLIFKQKAIRYCGKCYACKTPVFARVGTIDTNNVTVNFNSDNTSGHKIYNYKDNKGKVLKFKDGAVDNHNTDKSFKPDLETDGDADTNIIYVTEPGGSCDHGATIAPSILTGGLSAQSLNAVTKEISKYLYWLLDMTCNYGKNNTVGLKIDSVTAEFGNDDNGNNEITQNIFGTVDMPKQEPHGGENAPERDYLQGVDKTLPFLKFVNTNLNTKHVLMADKINEGIRNNVNLIRGSNNERTSNVITFAERLEMYAKHTNEALELGLDGGGGGRKRIKKIYKKGGARTTNFDSDDEREDSDSEREDSDDEREDSDDEREDMKMRMVVMDDLATSTEQFIELFDPVNAYTDQMREILVTLTVAFLGQYHDDEYVYKCIKMVPKFIRYYEHNNTLSVQLQYERKYAVMFYMKLNLLIDNGIYRPTTQQLIGKIGAIEKDPVQLNKLIVQTLVELPEYQYIFDRLSAINKKDTIYDIGDQTFVKELDKNLSNTVGAGKIFINDTEDIDIITLITSCLSKIQVAPRSPSEAESGFASIAQGLPSIAHGLTSVAPASPPAAARSHGLAFVTPDASQRDRSDASQRDRSDESQSDPDDAMEDPELATAFENGPPPALGSRSSSAAGLRDRTKSKTPTVEYDYPRGDILFSGIEDEDADRPSSVPGAPRTPRSTPSAGYEYGGGKRTRKNKSKTKKQNKTRKQRQNKQTKRISYVKNKQTRKKTKKNQKQKRIKNPIQKKQHKNT
jgi:hypothetical protein